MAKKKKSGKRKWLILGLLLTVIAIAAFVFYKKNNAPEGIEVDTAKAELRDIKETVSASGRIYPETEVIISSDVSGEIVELYVEEGDSVRMGQTLLRIDPEAYQSAVERSQANVNNSKAQMANAKAQIESTKAAKYELETQLIQAERVHQRNIDLFKDGVVSQAQFDETLSQVETLQARVKSAEASIAASQESARAAEYNVMSAEASLKEMRTNLNRTTIKAPTAGVISSLSVEQGERVVGTAQMAGTEIMRISDLSTMEAQVEVSENDILKVSLGDKAEIEVDAYLDRTFSGVVTEIANSASNVASGTGNSLNTDQVTNFIVKIRLDADSYQDLIANGKEHPFRPGMSTSVDIVTDVKSNVLTVPIQSVAMRDLSEEGEEENYGEVIFAYEADTARMIPVSTGIQDDEFIYILSGLSEGVEIVSGPYSALSKEIESGAQLRIKEEDTPKDKK